MNQTTQPTPPIILTFAASDPTGGAGIQADLMTQCSMGCHPLTVITALTVQDTLGIDSVMPIDAEWIEDQARAVLEDMQIDAFKIGLLGSIEAISIVAAIVSDYPDIPLIFDPVLASGRGDELSDEDMISAMQELLLPQTTILTPNSIEARRLSEDDEGTQFSLEECAQRLIGFGCEYVLLTGTHENTPQVANDLYCETGLIRRDTWDRLPGSYHGSGCTLASAVAAGLAAGIPVTDAVRQAQEYTWQALAGSFHPGMGQYIPDRFFWARPPSGKDTDTAHA